MKHVLSAMGMIGAAGIVSASVINIDFSLNDTNEAMLNGQQVIGADFDQYFDLTTQGDHAGAAVFDSTASGPNAGGRDPDLLVNLGNILILQENGRNKERTTTLANGRTGFVTPDDKWNNRSAGVFNFAFNASVELLSLDLVDIDGGNSVTVILTDESGDERVYSVPQNWTDEVNQPSSENPNPQGYGTLDLTTLVDQASPDGNGVFATATEDDGFDASSVVNLEVRLMGSGGIDNLRFVPTPGSAGLLAAAGLVTLRRRRM